MDLFNPSLEDLDKSNRWGLDRPSATGLEDEQKENMRILLINGVYGYASTGTIVRDIQSLCGRQGIECYVAYSETNLPADKLQSCYKIGSDWEKKLHAFLCRVNGQQAYFSHIATCKFIKYIKSIKPDIVHLHTIHGNYLNMPMLLTYLAKNNIRTIITMHDCWYYTGGCFHYTQADCFRWQQNCGNCPKKKVDTPALFLDKSSQILVDRKRLFDAIPNLTVTGVSNWICEESKKGIFKDKLVVTIHNGIDTQLFRPTILNDIEPTESLQNLKSSLDGHFIIMGLAGKWLDIVNREAFEYILSKMEVNDRFLFFGCDDAKLTTLNALSFPKKQREKIITFGYINNRQQLAVLYSLADVFINCTREESFSLINVEPQACGTPVVTYANTGAQETVNDKCSYGVPTCDYKAMWEKISLIRKNGKRHYSDDCIQWVKGNFDMQENYQKYLKLYSM